MATTPTTKLGIPLPVAGSGEPFTVAAYNFGINSLDGAVGAAVVTSSTRPGTPWTGQIIHETDTDLTFVWDGVAWVETGTAVEDLDDLGDVDITSPSDNQVLAYSAGISSWVNTTFVALPSGLVATFAMNTAPTGWLKANGATISRATYANLFTAIGTTFGAGDGSTTFRLPDMRGEFPRGWDDGRGVDSGRVFGSAQGHLFASHGHNLYSATSSGGTTYGIGSGSAKAIGATGTSAALGYYTNIAGVGVAAVQATGGSETRPRNIALLYCIKF
jgi:microcystin-dependent protein